jgi:hypothetical protein
MSEPKEAKKAQRRDFLRLAGLGTLAGAAAAVGSSPQQAEAAATKTSTGSGYQVTEHVKKAYDLSRF